MIKYYRIELENHQVINIFIKVHINVLSLPYLKLYKLIV